MFCLDLTYSMFPNTFWLKLDFLFGMLYFLFPSHPLPIGGFITLSCCFMVSCTPLEFSYCGFWSRSHLQGYGQAKNYHESQFFFWSFWFLVYDWQWCVCQHFHWDEHRFRRYTCHQVWTWLSNKNIGFKAFELCRQIQQVPKKKWESASDFSCQIRFALELEHASNVYSVFPRRRFILGLCQRVI